MLSEGQIEQFREVGFLKAGRALTDGEADALRERMFAIIEGRSARNPERVTDFHKGKPQSVVQIVNAWEADDLFCRHLYNPRICEMVAQLMGTDTVRVWHDQIQYKPPQRGGPTDWHQDHPYWPIIQPADLVSAWVALDDATVENGCMWMVPHSHQWGPHKGGTIGTDPDGFRPMPDMALVPVDKIDLVPCEVKKGEVMFHHCLTWHGSPPNGSERGRPAIAVHYMPGYTRYEPHGATHLVEHNVEVPPGAVLQGKHFPTVWENGQPVQPPAANPVLAPT